MTANSGRLILVTGASGYIASHLIPRLLECGYRVRCMVRRPESLKGRRWYPRVEVTAGEIMDPASLPAALDGVWTAYYLIHNMASGRGYTGIELEGARNFAAAAEAAQVEHIIYLGGLANPAAEIAAHMRSRIETGESLRRGRVPVTEFRAGVIVGPGSISFEMIRFITELFPIVPGPVWTRNLSQPIAAANVFDYLLAALENPSGRGRVFEIGGPQVMHYSELMLEYARARGLRRRLLILPYIPIWFMSYGIGIATPVPAPIAYALIDALRSDSRVHEASARDIFPEVELIPYNAAVRMSLDRLHPGQLEPVWRDRRADAPNLRHEGFFINHRRLHVAAPPEKALSVAARLGENGDWLYANPLWRLRRRIDSLFRKPGSSSPLAFHRVEAVDDSRVLVHLEPKAPGEA
ncbi:MAG: NAD(P)H-binding protein, partial [Bacteroidota bacterium]